MFRVNIYSNDSIYWQCDATMKQQNTTMLRKTFKICSPILKIPHMFPIIQTTWKRHPSLRRQHLTKTFMHHFSGIKWNIPYNRSQKEYTTHIFIGNQSPFAMRINPCASRIVKSFKWQLSTAYLWKLVPGIFSYYYICVEHVSYSTKSRYKFNSHLAYWIGSSEYSILCVFYSWPYFISYIGWTVQPK